ncbi:MAG: cyclic nucleotide-binding domain-containing protein [bacterium]
MFFDNLTKTELEKLESIGILKTYEQNTSIVEEGLPGSSFAVILTGRAEVRKRLEGGRYKALVVLGPFDLIGELGFLGAKSRNAGVVALERTEILSFERDSFQALAAVQPHIGMTVYHNMARILAERLCSNNSNLMDTIIWALGHARGATDEPPKAGSTRLRWAG